MTVYARDIIFNELDRLHYENTNDVLDDNNVKLPSILDYNTESDANDQSNVRRSVRDKNPPNRFGDPNFGKRLCKEKLIQLIKIKFGL